VPEYTVFPSIWAVIDTADDPYPSPSCLKIRGICYFLLAFLFMTISK